MAPKPPGELVPFVETPIPPLPPTAVTSRLVTPSGTETACSPPVKLKLIVVAALAVAPLAADEMIPAAAARTMTAAASAGLALELRIPYLHPGPRARRDFPRKPPYGCDGSPSIVEIRLLQAQDEIVGVRSSIPTRRRRDGRE
jgi:hypothetical protein